MMFRPKIFISSTFKENEKLRKKIREFFYSVGAEPLLFEHELTPSISKKSYRINILEADFVIMIVKENYGTKTELGISGIHEEYRIALDNNIPLHVYLKRNEELNSNNNNQINPLIDEIDKDGISYYYFKDDRELMKRLMGTTFAIAKDIMLNQLEKNNIPEETIFKLAFEKDYYTAMEVVNIIEDMKNIQMDYEYDYISSNIIAACIEPIYLEFRKNKHKFINWELENQLHKMLDVANEFICHSGKDYTAIGQGRELKVQVIGQIIIENLTYNKCSNWTQKDYCEALENFFNEYKKFIELVKNIRVEADIMR